VLRGRLGIIHRHHDAIIAILRFRTTAAEGRSRSIETVS
jgi:hypothetical protein